MKSWFQLLDFHIKIHTNMLQINLLTLWHDDYSLFTEWKWIIIEVSILIVFMLNKEEELVGLAVLEVSELEEEEEGEEGEASTSM